MSLAGEPQGAHRGNAGLGAPGREHLQCYSSVFTSLPGTALKGWDKVSTRHWQDLEGKPCAVGGLGGGQTRQGASTPACSGFLWAGGGHALHFNLRSKRGAPLLPSGLQQQHDLCQVHLARPANEQAQRALQLTAALCELRAGTSDCIHLWML